MADLALEKKILSLSKDYTFNETVGSFLLLLSSCMEDFQNQEFAKTHEIHEDILAIKKEIYNQTCALKLTLTDSAIKASALEDTFETRKKLTSIYENIYHYYSQWNIISSLVSDEIAIRKYGEKHNDEKKLDLARFYSDCMEFMKTAQDLSQYKHHMGQIFKCVPLKMARNKYFDLVYKSLETAFGGESEESVSVSIDTFRKTFATEKEPDYGKYFPDVAEALKEKAEVVPNSLSDDELDMLYSDLNVIFETLTDIEDYFQETFSALGSLIILYYQDFNVEDLTADNFGYKDVYNKVCEIIENPSDNLFNERVIEMIEEYIEPIIDKANALNAEELKLLEKVKDFDQVSEELSSSLAVEGFVRAIFYSNINDDLFDFSFDEEAPPASEEYKKQIFGKFIDDMREYFSTMPQTKRKASMQMLLSSLPIAFDIHEFMAYIQNGIDSVSSNEELLLIVDKIGTVFVDNGFNYDGNAGQEHHHHDEDCSCGHDHNEHHHHDDNCSCGHEHHHH